MEKNAIERSNLIFYKMLIYYLYFRLIGSLFIDFDKILKYNNKDDYI